MVEINQMSGDITDLSYSWGKINNKYGNLPPSQTGGGGSLKFETIKFGHESRGNQTRKGLC
jgi:hypothetical protein